MLSGSDLYREIRSAMREPRFATNLRLLSDTERESLEQVLAVEALALASKRGGGELRRSMIGREWLATVLRSALSGEGRIAREWLDTESRYRTKADRKRDESSRLESLEAHLERAAAGAEPVALAKVALAEHERGGELPPMLAEHVAEAAAEAARRIAAPRFDDSDGTVWAGLAERDRERVRIALAGGLSGSLSLVAERESLSLSKCKKESAAGMEIMRGMLSAPDALAIIRASLAAALREHRDVLAEARATGNPSRLAAILAGTEAEAVEAAKLAGYREPKRVTSKGGKVAPARSGESHFPRELRGGSTESGEIRDARERAEAIRLARSLRLSLAMLAARGSLAACAGWIALRIAARERWHGARLALAESMYLDRAFSSGWRSLTIPPAMAAAMLATYPASEDAERSESEPEPELAH